MTDGFAEDIGGKTAVIAGKQLYAIYDAQRDVYVIPSSLRQDSAGDVEYRFRLVEPDAQEPRYTGVLEKAWIDPDDGPSYQAFTIGKYVYKDSFEQEVQNIIQQARTIASDRMLDEFTSIVEVVKMDILESGEPWEPEGWWDEYLIDTEKLFASVDGLWTLGPEDAYTVRWRQ